MRRIQASSSPDVRSRACFKKGLADASFGPQGLKPDALLLFSARLKSCPDTQRIFKTMRWPSLAHNLLDERDSLGSQIVLYQHALTPHDRAVGAVAGT